MAKNVLAKAQRRKVPLIEIHNAEPYEILHLIMRKVLNIILTSLNLTWQEFKSHKVRTLLSLSGVAFGIFCIISVLATVNSLEYAIQKDIKSLGSNTVYIDKWEYSGGNDYPWWKYVKRPEPRYDEMKALKLKVPSAANVAFEIEQNDKIEFDDNIISGISYYGVSEDFFNIQKVEVVLGRNLQQSDFDYASNSILIGFEVAKTLFGTPAKARSS